MKKIYNSIVGAFLLGTLPGSVFAQTGIEPTMMPTNLPSETEFGKLLTQIINWALGLVGLIAVIMLIYGGFRYLTAAGNDESVSKAKNTIMYALIGIVIIILSYAIVSTITRALGFR
jgi:cytochrome bd-type quinol oxidase subunit 2